MGTSQHLYLATHSVWQIKTPLLCNSEYYHGPNAICITGSNNNIVCAMLIIIAVCSCLNQKINTTYHLSSRVLGQGTPPLPPPLPPPPHRAWCLLCCPRTNWCHPARDKQGERRDQFNLWIFSLNTTGSAMRCWKHMDTAQSQYSHYINAPWVYMHDMIYCKRYTCCSHVLKLILPLSLPVLQSY